MFCTPTVLPELFELSRPPFSESLSLGVSPSSSLTDRRIASSFMTSCTAVANPRESTEFRLTRPIAAALMSLMFSSDLLDLMFDTVVLYLG